MKSRNLTNKPIEVSEEQECIWLVDYLDLLQRQGKVKMYTHIPNSTYTPSWGARMRNKRLGLNPGMFDYLIIFRTKLLALEMKKARGGVVSDEQKDWKEAFESVGVAAAICHGFEKAKHVIDLFL